MMTAGDGSELLISIHGQSVQERAPGNHRAILARVELTTEADSYGGLNTCFLVGEGEIDKEREHLVARHVRLRRRARVSAARASRRTA
jgi:hypothetical protein